MNQDYEVLSVESTSAPYDLEGANWHRYTIGQGKNRIFGYRQGDLRTITRSVEELVSQLNERRFGSKGRVHLYMSSRGKPAATQ